MVASVFSRRTIRAGLAQQEKAGHQMTDGGRGEEGEPFALGILLAKFQAIFFNCDVSLQVQEVT